MSEQPTGRYYASKQYLLPADNVETQRLNTQHNMIINAFGSKLSMAPTNLTTGDRVLESAAGSGELIIIHSAMIKRLDSLIGIWALEFFEKNRAEGVTLDIECIDISSAQFPSTHPPEIHFSVNSIVNLPNPDWTDTFSFAHQRLLVAAMNNTLWRSAVAELFRVIKPGGWVELVEIEAQDFSSWSVGPNSTKLASLINALYGGKGVIGDLSVYLPVILKEAGFVNVQCDPRRVTIGGEVDATPHKGTEVKGGYGVVDTVEEYEALVRGTEVKLKNSKEAYTTFFAILARKPENT
ncbi:hypothetical protein LENED_004184 [Lentinula edodes]|uniref:S-adenosyl-L-methionine-dependent methyltransferase n=1 Tax=Lentinula edodes TaxID=5353 RepID=A0A1Q3E5J0_LENED|nr:hypothetical protein LENED_004184 [Lentinula edodes]